MSHSFRSRVSAMSHATGLSAGQLGLARVYDSPVFYSTPTSTSLAGEEILIKDLNQVAGKVTTLGSQHLAFVAEHSDSAARALLDRGAVLVGASASAEFGTTAYTEPVGMDEPVNPLQPAMMAGGSSGGAAVAVARGLVDIAHASDGGGSIRIPAACCGLVGLKPAHDHTALAGFTSMAQGFIAKDIPTTRRAYGLESGAAGPVRVGYTNVPFHSRSTVDPQIAATTAAAAGLLATHPRVAGVAQAAAPYAPGSFQYFADFLALRCAKLPGDLSPLTSWLRARGQQIPDHHLQPLVDKILGLDPEGPWADLDVVATPTLACAPPAPGSFSALPPAQNFLAQTVWTPWGTLWNLKGWASVSVPLVDPARVPGRWPIALLLGAVSDRVSESDLLDLAEHVMTTTSHLPPEELSIAQPGDIAALNYEPKPRHEH